MSRRRKRSDGPGFGLLLMIQSGMTAGALHFLSRVAPDSAGTALRPLLYLAIAGAVAGAALAAWRFSEPLVADTGSQPSVVSHPVVTPGVSSRPRSASPPATPPALPPAPATVARAMTTPVSQPKPPPPPPSLGEQLRAIDWFQFEKLVAALYRSQGFTVERRGGAQPDGGVDLVATKDGVKGVIQCKHWRTYQVRPDKIRELVGTRTIEGAQKACLITLRGFSTAAQELARQQDIQLIDEHELLQHIEALRHTPAWGDIQRLLDSQQKTCPRCEHPLVHRTVRKGPNTGSMIWGCTRFPACRFVLDA